MLSCVCVVLACVSYVCCIYVCAFMLVIHIVVAVVVAVVAVFKDAKTWQKLCCRVQRGLEKSLPKFALCMCLICVCVAYVCAVVCLLPGGHTMRIDEKDAATAMVCGCHGVLLQWGWLQLWFWHHVGVSISM